MGLDANREDRIVNAMSAQDLLAITTYTLGRKYRRIAFSDTRDLIVEWPIAIAPATHAEAAAEALSIVRTAVQS